MADDPLLPRAQEYVTATGEGDLENLKKALPEARELVENWIGEPITKVPESIRNRAIIEVTAELFYRKNSRNGVSEFAGTDMQPFRIRKDPMAAAYPILKQYIPGGLA